MKRKLQISDILVLAFGTMIGWGWIMLSGNWVKDAGMVGAIIAFIVGMIMCIIVGLIYAELTSALPLAGGELVFSYRALGYHASWFTGWMITFAYIGVTAWEGPAFATAVDYIIPIKKIGYLWTIAEYDIYLSWIAVAVVMGIILVVVNCLGIKQASILQAIATLTMAIGGVTFFLTGIVNGQIQYSLPVVTNKNGILSVLAMVPSMFVGFDVIPQAAEEMKVPLNKISKVMITSIVFAASWYIMIIVGLALSAPAEIRGQEGIVIANAFSWSMHGSAWGKFIIVSAIFGILTSWNGFLIGATRVVFAMGRARMIPKCFSKLHKKFDTPILAILLVGGVSILSPLLGRNALIWFVNASALGTVITYFMISISFLVLRRKEPDLERPYKIKHGKLNGWIAAIFTLLFITIYLPFGQSPLGKVEWILVITWVAFGLLLYFINNKHNYIHSDTREDLMFGNEYARKEGVER